MVRTILVAIRSSPILRMSLLFLVVESGDDLSFRSWSSGSWWFTVPYCSALFHGESSVDPVGVFGLWEAECVVEALLFDWAALTDFDASVCEAGLSFWWVPPVWVLVPANSVLHPCEVHFVMTLSVG